MAQGKLKRVSPTTEAVVRDVAGKESRTFIAQLDRIVEAGLTSLGYHDEAQTLREQAAADREEGLATAS